MTLAPLKSALAIGSIALLTLTACGNQTDGASTPAGTAPARIPAAQGKVTGQGTVMDTGRPELCLGAIAESYPPQCSGLPIVGWDWSKVAGQFEKAGDIRWGSFVLTGTFDGTTFTMTEPALSLATYDPAAPAGNDPFKTPCTEPDGGWKVLDPAKTNDQTMQQVFEKASQLEGYAGSWITQSPDSRTDEGAQDDPTKVIVNVTVTGNVKAAEADLQEIQAQLQKLPGLLTSNAQNDRVTAEVVNDDGSLQAWVDGAYGTGRIVISSALKHADQPLD
jgi:hypothetical protein